MRRSSQASSRQRERTGPNAGRKKPTLSDQERRTVFAHMIRAELKSGTIDGPRRRRLLRFARDIDISPDDAEMMIDDARYNLGLIDPARLDCDANLELPFPRAAAGRWARFVILGAAILLAEWLIVQTLLQ